MHGACMGEEATRVSLLYSLQYYPAAPYTCRPTHVLYGRGAPIRLRPEHGCSQWGTVVRGYYGTVVLDPTPNTFSFSSFASLLSAVCWQRECKRKEGFEIYHSFFL
jgi:hypothetical protein